MNYPDLNTVHTLSLVTRDHPGVLVRIALVFARRGRNIESLAVSPGAVAGYSRMTITSRGAPDTLEQIIKQLGKLIDVVDVIDHLQHAPLEAEVALIKVPSQDVDAHIVADTLARQSGSQVDVVDQSENAMVIRVMGTVEHVESAVAALRSHPIHELVRSGPVVMDKGASPYTHLLTKPAAIGSGD